MIIKRIISISTRLSDVTAAALASWLSIGLTTLSMITAKNGK